MNGLLDDSLVGVILVVAGTYALYALGPKALRQRLLRGLSAALAASPRFLGLRGLAGRVAGAKVQGSCGGCEDCGSTTSPSAAAAPEVRVAVSSIARRR